MKVYVQRTGNMYDDSGNLLFTAYSGGDCGLHPEGVNNPDLQFEHNIGPIPVGFYIIGTPIIHPRLGPSAMPLIPNSINNMQGRAGFFCHGDTNEDVISDLKHGSDGCIVKSPAATRLLIWNKGEHILQVVSEESDAQAVFATPDPT